MPLLIALLLLVPQFNPQARLYVSPGVSTFNAGVPKVIAEQVVTRAVADCHLTSSQRNNGHVCVSVWVVDPATNAGLNHVAVRIGNTTVFTNAAGFAERQVAPNQDLAFGVTPPSGYGNGPVLITHTITTKHVLAIWELAHR